MKRVRGGSGLGDSLYVRPICDELVRRGEQVTVLSNYPDIFIGSGVKVLPFCRDNFQVLAHYVGGKSNTNTNQWQDVCESAKIQAPMEFEWRIQNRSLVKDLMHKADGRPIVVAHGGRNPMGRTDGFGIELLPERQAFDAVLGLMGDCFTVGIGSTDGLKYRLPVGYDLSGQTSVSDLIDIASVCNGIVAQCSFAIPLAECLNKPLLAIWGNKSASSTQAYVKTITPQKVLSKASSRWVMDNCGKNMIEEAVDAFRRF